MFGASKCRRVVGDVGPRQIIGWKSRRYLLPSRDTLSRIGLCKSPEVPGRPVLRISGHGARSKITYRFRSASSEPVRVRQCHQYLRVVGVFGRRAFEIR